MTICEMCGKDTKLLTADVEGVELKVCSGCAKYGVVKKQSFSRSFSQRRARPEENLCIVSNYNQLIRKAREAKGMSQEEFSKMLNERESVIAKWESKTMRPRIGIAKRLEKILGITLIERDVAGNSDDSAQGKKSKKKVSDEFTLGDFIKVRKRK